jgi:AraC family transcriptional regulator
MTRGSEWTNEAIISDTFGAAPEVQASSPEAGWTLCRWRHFVGSYNLPALPRPMYVVHIDGKPNVRTWQMDDWSERASRPSDATLMPGGLGSGWLVDGALDVVTLTLDLRPGERALEAVPRQMRFAFSDPLGVALARQALTALYEPASAERDSYVEALMTAARAHVLHGLRAVPASLIPGAAASAYRLHRVISAIREQPDGAHNIEELAAAAGLTTSHFCRMFRRATGASPHQYVLKTRLERAETMLVQSDMALSQIAEFLGFKSQAHFTRVFQQRFGVTPGKYRQRRRPELH